MNTEEANERARALAEAARRAGDKMALEVYDEPPVSTRDEIEELERMIEEDEEILSYAHDLRVACSVRASNLFALISCEGGVGDDGIDLMTYRIAERDLLDLESVVKRKKAIEELELERLRKEAGK